jgi:hypothetical protein
VKPGDVTLIAPFGTVNAGDAGIRVSGNFTVAAMFVLNAENIKVGGESKGVPKVAAAPVNLTVETKDKAAADAVKDATQTGPGDRPSVIIVEVLGYGGGSNEDRQKDDENRRKTNEQRSYNMNSVIQLVGNGCAERHAEAGADRGGTAETCGPLAASGFRRNARSVTANSGRAAFAGHWSSGPVGCPMFGSRHGSARTESSDVEP